MTDTKPTLEEMIAHHEAVIKLHPNIAGVADYGTLKYLKELKRIREVQVPDEPQPTFESDILNWSMRPKPTSPNGDIWEAGARHTWAIQQRHIDTLRDLLRQETVRGDQHLKAFVYEAERADKLQSKLAELELTNKLANKMMEELK
jgi:prophage maintenance system killer protein